MRAFRWSLPLVWLLGASIGANGQPLGSSPAAGRVAMQASSKLAESAVAFVNRSAPRPNVLVLLIDE
eukprot:SAG31_NODE_1500_length_8090_cov_10.522588_10_plen_67_part_00